MFYDFNTEMCKYAAIEDVFYHRWFKHFTALSEREGYRVLSDIPDESVLLAFPGITKRKIENLRKRLEEFDTPESFRCPMRDTNPEYYDFPLQHLEFFDIPLRARNSLVNVSDKEDIHTFSDMLGMARYKLQSIIGEETEQMFERGLFSKSPEEMIHYHISNLSESDKEIVNERLNGNTFKKISEEHNCTKQNISQIEDRIVKKITPFMDVIIDRGKAIHLSDFPGGDELMVYHYLKKKSVRKRVKLNYDGVYNVFTSEDLNSLDIPEEIPISEVENLEIRGYIPKEDNGMYLLNSGYIISGDRYIAPDLGKAICETIKTHFHGGMHLTLDISEMKEIIKDEFGLLTPSNRRFAYVIANTDGIVYSDKGMVDIKEKYNIPKELLSKITEYIETKNSNKVYYVQIFNEFKDELKECGINNYFLLHGLLKYTISYPMKKDYIVLSSQENNDIYDEINDYIVSKGYPIPIIEIEERFGVSWIRIYNECLKNSKMIWLENSVYSMDFINISEETYQKMKSVIGDKYCSEKLLYEEMEEYRDEMNINSPREIYEVARKLFPNMRYRFPHIVSPEMKENISSENISKWLYPDITYEEYIELVKKHGWSMEYYYMRELKRKGN